MQIGPSESSPKTSPISNPSQAPFRAGAQPVPF
jgi:hypothetical protein